MESDGFIVLAGIYAALGVVTIIGSAGMALGVVKGMMREFVRRLESLEVSRGNIYDRINPMGESIARIEGMMNAEFKEKHKR